MSKPYTSREVAEMIGISIETLYHTRLKRHLCDGMPRPISERRPLKWERSGFDAWLTRHHPARPKNFANDAFAVPEPVSDDEHRARLMAAYGRIA